MMRYIRIAVAVVALALLVWQVQEFRGFSKSYETTITSVPIKEVRQSFRGTSNPEEQENNILAASFTVQKYDARHRAQVLVKFAYIGLIVVSAGLILTALKD